MKIAIMQPYFLPYLGYFQLINSVDRFIILDDVNYIKKGYINRNNLLLNNELLTFTIPLAKASQNKFIDELSISSTFKIEKEKHLKMFETAYKKAPYFENIIPVLEKIYYYEELKLSLFLTNSINLICKYLGINTEIIRSSSIFDKKGLRGEERIIDISITNCADIYINAIGGKELYNEDTFKKNNLELFFLKGKEIEYNQFSNEFVPFLSIIDVLMFNDRNTCISFLNEYNLIK